MTIGHIHNPTPFRPSLRGGGSNKGKPHDYWPWIIKIVADGVVTRWAGSLDARRVHRKQMPITEFKQQVDALLPGWEDYIQTKFSPRKTSFVLLLMNRVYKSMYNGTSARGKNHDPYTRATMSKEHWTNHHPANSPLGQIYESVLRGAVIIPNWKNYL